MSQYPEPKWTQDRKVFRTIHAACRCSVYPVGTADIRWYWSSVCMKGGGFQQGSVDQGSVDSREVAQTCALRAAEASAVLDACQNGHPPESSGFPPQFSATDPTLPTPVGVFTPELDGTLAVSIWATNEDGQPMIIGFSEISVGSRDEFLRQIGEHLVHLGKYGWTSVHPEQRKELFASQSEPGEVTEAGEIATEEAE